LLIPEKVPSPCLSLAQTSTRPPVVSTHLATSFPFPTFPSLPLSSFSGLPLGSPRFSCLARGFCPHPLSLHRLFTPRQSSLQPCKTSAAPPWLNNFFFSTCRDHFGPNPLPVDGSKGPTLSLPDPLRQVPFLKCFAFSFLLFWVRVSQSSFAHFFTQEQPRQEQSDYVFCSPPPHFKFTFHAAFHLGGFDPAPFVSRSALRPRCMEIRPASHFTFLCVQFHC